MRTGLSKERNAMPKKILIIDDDPVIVKYLMAIFSDNGYATCSAGSSMEGLDLVKKERSGHVWRMSCP